MSAAEIPKGDLTQPRRPTATGEANGSPYSAYREQAPRELTACSSARHTALRCLTADEFFAAESPANLVVPALGICPGPPTGFVGQAFVGKTIVGLSMGLSVATGRDLWGTWSVQRGPWLHLDFEQGRRHTKARIHRLSRGFGIPDPELRELIASRMVRVSVLPDLRLTTEGALEHFRQAFEGVRLVTCDSLRVMIGGVDENSSQVRSLIGILSAASDATNAAVVLLHHAGKPAPEGERTRKDMSRGSSGIVDEFQSLFVATKKKGEPVTCVTHEKDRELGEPIADFGLRIDDVATDDGDLRGGLRVVHVDREQLQATTGGDAAKFSRLVRIVRDCIRENPGVAGVESLRELLGGRMQPVRAAVNTLLAAGDVVERKPTGRGRGRQLYVAHAAPAEGT